MVSLDQPRRIAKSCSEGNSDMQGRLVLSGAVVLAGASLLSTQANARRPGELPTRVTVLVYDYAAVPAQTLYTAEQDASNVFRHAGIEVAWVACRKDASACDGFESAPVLRLQRRFSRTAGRLDVRAMGFCLGNLAAVSLERVARAAQSGPARLPEILGSVITHEIGHVLMPHWNHSQSGIMRARFDLYDWMLISQGTLWFTADQARSLRKELDSRVQQASSANPVQQSK